MNNQATATETKEIKFYDDTLMGVKTEDGKVYLAVKKTAINIGLTEDQAKSEVKKIQESQLFKNQWVNLSVKFDTQHRNTIFLIEKYVPMWLAQINITPKMKLQNPEAVEKLLLYQNECVEILSKAFLGDEQSKKNFYDRFDIRGELQEFKNEIVGEFKKELFVIKNENIELKNEIFRIKMATDSINDKLIVPRNNSTYFEELRVRFLDKINHSNSKSYYPLYEALVDWTGISIPESKNRKAWVIENIGMKTISEFVNGVLIDRIVRSDKGHWFDLSGIYQNDIEWNKILKHWTDSEGNIYCGYCMNTFLVDELQKEHLIPKRDLDSSDCIYNIICACSDCNFSKNENKYAEWYVKQPFFKQNRLDYINSHIEKYSIN
jgi:hypothetical protein